MWCKSIGESLNLTYNLCICAGGYKGQKDGFQIPKGTDVFVSVSKIATGVIWCFC